MEKALVASPPRMCGLPFQSLGTNRGSTKLSRSRRPWQKARVPCAFAVVPPARFQYKPTYSPIIEVPLIRGKLMYPFKSEVQDTPLLTCLSYHYCTHFCCSAKLPFFFFTYLLIYFYLCLYSTSVFYSFIQMFFGVGFNCNVYDLWVYKLLSFKSAEHWNVILHHKCCVMFTIKYSISKPLWIWTESHTNSL